MDLTFINYLTNFLTTSLFLMSFMNCLPQQYYSQKPVKFPNAFRTEEDLLSFAEDRLDSLVDKLVRSPQIWSAEAQAHEILSQESSSSGTRPTTNKRKNAVRVPDHSSDAIVFPDEMDDRIKNKSMDLGNVSPCPNGKTFCEDADNYPQSYLRTVLLKDEVKFREFFGKDVIPEEKNIMNRIDDKFNEKSLCKSKVTTIFPRRAQNEEGNWLFIANLDNYIQGIRIEECLLTSGSSCDPIASFPAGYSATCQQKYIYRKLVALNNEGKTMPDSFPMPSCCVCMFKFDGVASRSGPVDQPPQPLPLSMRSGPISNTTAQKITHTERVEPRKVSNRTKVTLH